MKWRSKSPFEWRETFAFTPKRIHINEDGSTEWVWLERYEWRHTGDVCYGGTMLERRRVGSTDKPLKIFSPLGIS